MGNLQGVGVMYAVLTHKVFVGGAGAEIPDGNAVVAPLPPGRKAAEIKRAVPRLARQLQLPHTDAEIRFVARNDHLTLPARSRLV